MGRHERVEKTTAVTQVEGETGTEADDYGWVESPAPQPPAADQPSATAVAPPPEVANSDEPGEAFAPILSVGLLAAFVVLQLAWIILLAYVLRMAFDAAF